MPDGFIAVIADLAPAEPPERFEERRVEVVRLEQHVAALTLPGCDDMRTYWRLAEACVESGRPALIALYMPDEKHQAAWVFRAGRRTHAFLQSPVAEGGSEPMHFAGLGQSVVEAPLAEGLALAGLAEKLDAVALCESIGHHAHA